MMCPSETSIEALLSATAGISPEIEAHLDACQDCRALLAVRLRALDEPGMRSVDNQDLTMRPLHIVPGERIGRYLIGQQLGAGAMGVVYSAHDPALLRDVAVKVLRNADPERPDPRLAREAQLLARLSHVNVLAIYDVGQVGDHTYITMELVRGPTLRRYIEDKRPSARGVLDVFLQAGRGLAAAHASGVVHRDFKPDNVLVTSDGIAKVSDFGLGRLDDRTNAARLTPSPSAVGTPAYMAPEQFLGEPGTPKSDQFAFCVALHEALFGTRPLAGSAGMPSKPRVSSINPRVMKALRRGLSANPAERFPTMDELLVELGGRDWRRRAALVAAASVAVAGIAITVSMTRVHAADSSSSCDAERAPVDQVWNEQAKAELRAAGSKHYSAALLDSIETRLDKVTRTWAEVSRAACKMRDASNPPQLVADLALRQECLALSLERTQKTIEMVRDGTLDERSTIEDLEERDCWSIRDDSAGGPSSPQLSALRSEIDSLPTTARAWWCSKATIEQRADLVARARELGNPRLLARAIMAKLACDAVDQPAVAEAAGEAATLADRGGDDWTRVIALGTVATHRALRGLDNADALAAARTVIERVPQPVPRQWAWKTLEAGALPPAERRAQYVAAYELAKASFGEVDRRTAQSAMNVAVVSHGLERLEWVRRAHAHHQRRLAIADAANNPVSAELGLLYFVHGAFEDAVALLEPVVAKGGAHDFSVMILAYSHAALGHGERVHEIIDAKLDNPAFESEKAVLRAWLSFVTGDAIAAEKHLAGTDASQCNVAALRAQLAWTAGQLDRAIADLAAFDAKLTDEQRFECGSTTALLAYLYARTGDQARARAAVNVFARQPDRPVSRASTAAIAHARGTAEPMSPELARVLGISPY